MGIHTVGVALIHLVVLSIESANNSWPQARHKPQQPVVGFSLYDAPFTGVYENRTLFATVSSNTHLVHKACVIN